MSRPSFRLRIALLACLLAGGALVGFALLSGWLIRDAKLDRLDARLENALVRWFARTGLRPSLRPRSGSGLEAELERELGPAEADAVAVQIADANGSPVYQSPDWPAGILPSRRAEPPSGLARPRWRDGPPRAGRSGESSPRLQVSRWQTQAIAGGRWRVGTLEGPLGQVTVAISLQSIQQEMATIQRIYLITIPAMLLLIATAAWGIAGRTLAPVRRLSRTMGRVTAQGLHQRVPSQDADAEFVELIDLFNQMLERLERSFHQASRFSGDAAHELKTPLAVLQGELEQAIQQAEPGSAHQQTLGSLLSEVTHLSSIVRKLLLLSLADAGQMALQRRPLNLSQLLQEQLEDIPWLAPDLTLDSNIDADLVVNGDRDLLMQVIQNLISNAIKYNLPQGWIRISASRANSLVKITVANAARAIPAADQDRLFERFYRGDAARDRQTEGLGLGLSLSREIALAHGGSLQLAEVRPEAVTFELSLPQD